MTKLWFSAKRYGWGWVPCSWEGWLITIVAAFGIGLNVAQAQYLVDSTAAVVIGSIIPSFVIAALLIVICIIKGEHPRWRWGN